jgi:hypothetical protein
MALEADDPNDIMPSSGLGKCKIAADAVGLFKEITVDVAKNSLMKITDICWITPLKNVDICWITHYRPVLAYPQAAAGHTIYGFATAHSF